METTTHDGDFSVHRRVHLPALTDQAVATVRDGLQALPGMQQVTFDLPRRRVELTYDASQLDFRRIERALAEAGMPPAGGRWARLRHAWYRYLDGNARANAEAHGACCSNPADVYASRHRD